MVGKGSLEIFPGRQRQGQASKVFCKFEFYLTETKPLTKTTVADDIANVLRLHCDHYPQTLQNVRSYLMVVYIG